MSFGYKNFTGVLRARDREMPITPSYMPVTSASRQYCRVNFSRLLKATLPPSVRNLGSPDVPRRASGYALLGKLSICRPRLLLESAEPSPTSLIQKDVVSEIGAATAPRR